MRTTRILLFAVLSCTLPAFGAEPRARDLGIPFDGKPGALNAITDVTGVTVGHETLIRDLPEERAVRTGVTAILPRGRESLATMVYAGWHALNGNGEMTGTTWLEESGFLEGPVMITNTHSIGAVHEGVIKWRIAQGDADATGYYWSLPVVAETWDGWLNDVNGFHVRPEHAGKALDAAKPGPVTEGAVGGGTGMVCFEFKCGIGTASRVVEADGKVQTLGVLVQANFGARAELTVAGVPVGGRVSGATVYSAVAPTGRSNSEPREPLERAMRATGLSGEVAPTGRSYSEPREPLERAMRATGLSGEVAPTGRSNSEPREPLERAMRATELSGEVAPTGRSNRGGSNPGRSYSSIIAVVATDAPLLPHQLERIARRVSLGIARTGGIAHNGSGDIFVAFSTANADAARGEADASISSIPNEGMDALFEATVQATEEAILNALVAGREMTGQDGHVVPGIDHEELRDLLRQHERLVNE